MTLYLNDIVQPLESKITQEVFMIRERSSGFPRNQIPIELQEFLDECEGSFARVWEDSPRADWLLILLTRRQSPDIRAHRRFASWCASQTPLPDNSQVGILLSDRNRIVVNQASGIDTDDPLNLIREVEEDRVMKEFFNAKAENPSAAATHVLGSAWGALKLNHLSAARDAATNALSAVRAFAESNGFDPDAAEREAHAVQANTIRREFGTNPFLHMDGIDDLLGDA